VRTQSVQYGNQILVLILLTLLAQGVVRVAIVPLWAHYDEASHYEYVRYIVENGQLPTPGKFDFAILKRIGDTYGPDTPIKPKCDTRGFEACIIPGLQFDEVPGYYALQALFQWLINLPSIEAQVTVARIVSVFIGAGVGLLGWHTLREAFPAHPLLAAGSVLMMSSLFGYIDLMSSLNNDVGAVAAVSLLIFASTLLIKYGLKWQSILLLMFAMILCVLAKSTSAIGIPLGLFVIGQTQWHKLPKPAKVAIFSVPMLIAALAFTWIPGDGLLLRPSIDNLVPAGGLNSRLGLWYDPQNWSHYWSALRWLFVTFWAGFGTGVSGLPLGFIILFAAISGAALIGLVRVWRTSYLSKWQRQLILLFALTIFAALVLSFLRVDPPGGYIPTARHLYVAIIPIQFFLLVGLGSWLPQRWRRVSFVGFVLFLNLVSVWSLIYVQLPWYVIHSP
jgi:hypothetical protein